jgi:PAS domain S-box-containing protein
MISRTPSLIIIMGLMIIIMGLILLLAVILLTRESGDNLKSAFRDRANQLKEKLTNLNRKEHMLSEQLKFVTLSSDIGMVLTKSSDLDKMLHRCLELLLTYMDAVSAQIWFVDQNEGVLELKSSAGEQNHKDAQSIRLRLDEQNQISLIALKRTAHTTNTAPDDPEIRDQDWIKKEGIMAFAGFPLTIEETVLGVMVLFSRHAFSDTACRVMAFVADEIALGIERFLSESSLRESHRKYRAIIEQTFQLFGIVSLDGTLIDSNRAALELAGVKKADVLGKPFWEGPWWNHSTELQDWLREAVQRAASGEVVQSEVIHPDQEGKPHFIDFRLSPIANEQGEIIFLVPTGHDITYRKRIENELHQAYKMEALGTLAGGIAHDFNNILAIILWHAELAIKLTKKESEPHKSLATILEAGQRAADLVTQILTFCRQGEQKLYPVQIHLIIKEVVKFVRASLPTTIEIQTKINSESLVLADPTQIHQVMMNLCANAGHAMKDKGGILTITLNNEDLDNHFTKFHPRLEPGRYVKLSVSDTGTGIPPEIMDRIFDPFFTTKEIGEGTGMGLSVVHGIVESCNGSISVYSEPNQGTVFHIYLPVMDVQSRQTLDQPVSIPRGSETVLFVDDEVKLANAGKGILEQLGYKVDICASGSEAYEKFSQDSERFDLIITDLTMPHMRGDELARKIRELRPNIPIIMITGLTTQTTTEQLKSARVDKIITKPLTTREIATAIRQVLADKKLD